QAANVELTYSQVNRYAFEPAISPHIAAGDTGVTIDPKLIQRDLEYALSQADICIVEGVGGWKAPLADSTKAGCLDVEKLALQLGLPVILVAGIRLGCINHTLLSIEKIQGSGANLVGWVANCCDPHTQRPEEQIESIAARTSSPLLCTLPFDMAGTTHKSQGTWSSFP
ncbi:MAG: dethiobiotin synthase, partial [Pseudomonadales bacterium]